MELEEIGVRAVAAKGELVKLSSAKKDECLIEIAKTLVEYSDYIIAENKKDVEDAVNKGMNKGLVDRLMLNSERIKGVAEGIRQISQLRDPIGEVDSMEKRPNGLLIGKKRVPLGVIGIIYESRPNVTADAFSLCFKTGNAAILKGGSDAINSNMAIVKCIKSALRACDVTEDAVNLVESTDRETTARLMKMRDYIDVLIPRGGAGLIRTVVENSTIPVIETGTGNCHIFVDETADFAMALDIIENAKTQRIGVCNACESLVVHSKIADRFIPLLVDRLSAKNVQIRGDRVSMKISDYIDEATQEDYSTEYLDYIISLKTVDTLEEAIDHINRNNTKHSEAIITANYFNAQRFLEEIDAAAVYVNASTRFTDGYEFGFGAEIGISTQKLHARGPMGLDALTTNKYIIYGDGQVRK